MRKKSLSTLFYLALLESYIRTVPDNKYHVQLFCSKGDTRDTERSFLDSLSLDNWSVRFLVQLDFLFFPYLLLSGDTFLHASMAVEGLGGRQDSRSYDGPRHRTLFWGGEEAEEEDAVGLSLGESSLPQLVGVQILPLRSSRSGQRSR